MRAYGCWVISLKMAMPNNQESAEMNFESSLQKVLSFAEKQTDQASEEVVQAICACREWLAESRSKEDSLQSLKKRIDEHTLYLRSGWSIEKPIAPDNTYDLLREISKQIDRVD